MKTYDRAKIGKFITWGGDHLVYDYYPNQVIKFSSLNFLMGTHKERHKGLSICKKYFGEFMLETRLVRSVDGKRLALLQPKIRGHYLTRDNLNNSSVQKQFGELLRLYRRMVADNVAPIDLIGREGLFSECLSNIFVTPNKKIYIIDGTLLRVVSHPLHPLGLLFQLLLPYALWKQRRTIAALEEFGSKQTSTT